MTTIIKKKEFETRLARTESLIGRLDALPDEDAKRSAVDAIPALLSLHGDGLARLLQVMEESGQRELVIKVAGDEIVAGLLLLHGLHPLTLEERVHGALEKVRPYLGSHGGNVELVGLTDGVVRLRLKGSCDGCPSSAQTLTYAIEREIKEAAPDIMGIEVEDAMPAKPAGFIPLTQIKPLSATPAPAPSEVDWYAVEGLGEVGRDAVQALKVSGAQLIFCRPAGSWIAYVDRCPNCKSSFAGAALEGVNLSCPGCDQRFDVRRAGRGIDGSSLHLEPVPLLVRDGAVSVAIPAVA